MNHQQRLSFSKQSLLGVSIGDAFGESFFGDQNLMRQHIQERALPETTWEFTDDTVMAIAVYEQLERQQSIHQDDLAQQFCSNHNKDVNRGYGATARRILREIDEGGDWRTVSSNVFEGMGSMGNGASMRVSPIGAYFYDDLRMVVEQATLSAQITHTHKEGVVGAVAVAVGAALAQQYANGVTSFDAVEYIKKIVAILPESDTTSKINKSLTVPYSYRIDTVTTILGNGSKICAQDTVPFALWCAAHNLSNFEEGLWKAVSALGDRDTICAIVGGILAISAPETLPDDWCKNVEQVDHSVFRNLRT